VVLQGGGALGAYEYGAMDALLELMDKSKPMAGQCGWWRSPASRSGAINAACVVGAKDRADARRRLTSLWSALSLDASHYWWTIAKNDFALFGVHGFYEPRRDVWNFLGWTNFYDTASDASNAERACGFDSLNASETAFVITAVIDRQANWSAFEIILIKRKRRPRSSRLMCWRAAACRRHFRLTTMARRFLGRRDHRQYAAWRCDRRVFRI
jgi:hypothetical protein